MIHFVTHNRDAPSLPLYVVREDLHTVSGVRPEKSLDIDCVSNLFPVWHSRDWWPRLTLHQDSQLQYLGLRTLCVWFLSLFFVTYFKETDLVSRFGVETICITGGGAYKYADAVHEILNVRNHKRSLLLTKQVPVHQLDEFEMIIKGLNFLLDYDASNEVFTVDWKTEEQTFGVFKEVIHIFWWLIPQGTR